MEIVYAKSPSVRSDFVVEPRNGRGGTRPRTLEKSAWRCGGMYRTTVATLEHTRAQVNLRFLADMEQAEKRDAARYQPRENS